MQTQAETRGKSTDLGYFEVGKNLQEWGGEGDKGGGGGGGGGGGELG